ncbi:MAG: ABC transporter permease [Candidatus Asgardarchaeia archaeon]
MQTRRVSLMLISFMTLGLIIFLFLFLPVVNVLLVTSPHAFIDALLDYEVQYSIFLSFYTAAIATLLAFIFGTPLAYILARKDFPLKRIVDSIIDIPILLPHTVAGIALLTLFGESGPIGAILSSYGIHFIDTIFGIIVAQMFVSAPFYIKTVRESFQEIDPRYHHVARTLGAKPSKAFLYIELPMATHSIITGCILSWARAISEFGAVIILAYYPTTAPVLIYKRFILFGLSAVIPITSVLIVITLIIFAIVKYIQLKGTKEE